jgi:hypothetical protein
MTQRGQNGVPANQRPASQAAPGPVPGATTTPAAATTTPAAATTTPAAASTTPAAATTSVPLATVTSQSFTVAARTGVDPVSLTTWDTGLARPARVLVPIDVQALVVGPKATVSAVQVLPKLADPGPTGDVTAAMPPVPPFSPPADRAPGVYLHWAAPDGVTSTRTLDPAPASTGDDIGAAMPPLADRWLVVRLGGGTPRRVRGWVIEAERGRRTDLGTWAPTSVPPDDGTSRTPHFPSGKLTPVAGGDPAWAAVYDAVEDRFAMHDDLSDLAPADANGPLSYLVCGWWSDAANDPLYVPDQAGYVARTSALKWSVPTVAGPTAAARDISADRLWAVGLTQPQTASASVVDTAGSTASATRSYVDPELAAAAAQVLVGQPADHPRLSLLHGSVIGVPPSGAGSDPMPVPSEVQVAVGTSATEAFATIITSDVQEAEQREAEERLVEAFSLGLISQLDTADGLASLDQAVHAAGFSASPGNSVRTDLLMTGDRLAAGAAIVEGRLDKINQTTLSAQAATTTSANAVTSGEKSAGFMTARSYHDVLDDFVTKTTRAVSATEPAPQSFTAVPVDVASEPFADATDPVVTLCRLNRSLRHGYDGRLSADNTLACRVSGMEVTKLAGLLDGADLVGPLGNGALPPECDTLLQELAVDDYTYLGQAATCAASATGLPLAAVTSRMTAEHALRYDTSELAASAAPAAVVAGPGGPGQGAPGQGGPGQGGPGQGGQGASGAGAVSTPANPVVLESGKDLLRAASLRDGTDASPLATTHWAQPWVPMFLEWTLGLRVDQTLDGWVLGDLDVEPVSGGTGDPGAVGHALEYSGRTLLTSVAARTFASRVASFVNEEQSRSPGSAVLQPDQDAALAAVASVGASLDLLSGALSDLHPQLLGLAWADANRLHRDAGGNPVLPAPVAPPVLLRGGVAWFTRLRVVDAFGRFVDLAPSSAMAAVSLQPVAQAQPPSTDVPAAQLLLRPRVMRPGRVLLDFVDASAPDGVAPAPAMVDQYDTSATVSPVCGWLLPDHFDGALEVYNAAAEPLGMLLEDINGAVVWEGAPGRPGPAGAPPSALDPSDTAARHAVRMATGMIKADAQRRADPDAPAGEESALSALLRVVDTTAWTVDPFGSLGNEHRSVLVGRPIAIMRMQVQIQVEDDLAAGAGATLDLGAGALAQRQVAYDALGSRQVTVRLGELTRTDDGVLGYFVDDDYSLFTPVSPEVLDAARASGRLVGQLGVLGPGMAGLPAVVPVTHPYVDDSEAPLQARPGRTVRLTVLMAPGGSAHATCGLFPRVRAELSREWLAEALAQLMPTFRVGPALVDPATVRVPKSTGLPKQQVFTSRPDPSSWRDDPIAAATQDALLPTDPAVVREGYLRVTLPDVAGP